jgi:broad specificity phosphatase PhoE
MPDEGNLSRPHDPPLNKTGEEQATLLAKRLSTAGIDRIVSSPQLRAEMTATPLAQKLGLPIVTVEGIAEIDRYADRYLSPETIRKEFPDRWDDFLNFPARFFGRDDETFRIDVLKAFTDIIAEFPEKTVAAFTHGTPIRVMIAHILNLANGRKFLIGHCSVSRVIGNTIDSLRIESVNEPLI